MRTAQEIQTAFADRAVLDGARRLFLVGIGGAGMSGLARLARRRGLEVAGSDLGGGPEVDRLTDEGFAVSLGHRAEPVLAFRPDVVVLSDAIPLDSPEVAAARRLDVPLLRRSQLLGWLLKGKKTIAVTGTHGKTTTTGMVAEGLRAASLDPLAVVGAKIPAWGGPILYGEGDWAVVEACEAYDSFHDLDPDVVVLTNLEPDHLDYHGTWERLRDSVARFVRRLPADGAVILPPGDAGADEATSEWPRRVVPAERAASSLPGEHNAQNAALALAAVRLAGADPVAAAQGVHAFAGAERRLQLVHDGELTVVDDYAHHPTEIAASLGALRERYPGRRLVVAFQPHLYSRTTEHLEGFARELSGADLLFLTDIYPAREDPIPGVSSARVAERVNAPVRYVPSRYLLPREVAAHAKPGDVVVGMGAGNIEAFAPAFVQEWERRRAGRLRVAVLLGGDSSEREVSLLSGRAVAAALRERGHEVMELDPAELLLGKGTVAPLTGPERPDCCFLALHGTNGEDGATQGLLRLLHLPFTGSDVLASAAAMDKAHAKEVLARAGIPIPRGDVVGAEDPLPRPGRYVVKPNANGSTVGVSFVEEGDDLGASVRRALAYDDAALVEEWLQGMEVSVPVLDGEALPIVEICPKGGAYDFERKYTPGATEEIVPARLPAELYAQVQELAVRAHVALGCAGATRTDLIVDERRGPVVLEVNTLPGLTGTSLLPNSAAAAGVSFPELCERILQEAIARHARP